MTTLFACTDELVAIAWLKTVPELSNVPVATTLAAQANWGNSPTFLQVFSSSLTAPSAYFPSHVSRILVSCWAKPKRWADAADLSQLVRAATYSQDSAREVAMHVQGYSTAAVLSVQTLSEPVRVTGDTNQLARYDITIGMEWV